MFLLKMSAAKNAMSQPTATQKTLIPKGKK